MPLTHLEREKPVSVSLILAERIMALFEEAGATEAERYCAVNVVTALIPVSVADQQIATSTDQHES